ncbi:MAG: hypothetical protein D6820_13225, partial [Lentisphaerae bacterium]
KQAIISARAKLPKRWSSTQVVMGENMLTRTEGVIETIFEDDGVLKLKLADASVTAALFPLNRDTFSYHGIRQNGDVLILPLANPRQPVTGLAGVLVVGEGASRTGYEFDFKLASPTGSGSVGEKTVPSEGANPNLQVQGANVKFSSLVWFVFLAFLGGILLNLMPCVLPILSIKIIHFLEHSQKGRHEALKHGLLYGVGIIVSFWIFAGAIIILKHSFQNLGWGFHLQSVGFVTALTILLFVFSLNFLGVFEFGSSLGMLGFKVSQRGEYLGSFLSGMLATVIATPCTAPFMGSAMSFALSQSALIIFVIFTSLGFGMGLPYVMFTAFPGAQKIIPKPGNWMIILKETMGFLLLLTVIILLYVLHPRLHAEGMAA